MMDQHRTVSDALTEDYVKAKTCHSLDNKCPWFPVFYFTNISASADCYLWTKYRSASKCNQHKFIQTKCL